MKNLLVGAATAASLLAWTPSGNTGQDTFSSPLVEVLSDSDTSKPESIIINGKYYLNTNDYQNQKERGNCINTINSKKPVVYANWLVVNDENGTKQVVIEYIVPAGVPLKNKKTWEVIPAVGVIDVTGGKTINFSKDWEYAPGAEVNASFTGHSLYECDGVWNVMLTPEYIVSSSKVPFSLEAAKRWCIVELVMVLEWETWKKDTLTNANDPSFNYKMVKSNNPSLNSYWDSTAVDSTYYFYDPDTVKTIPDNPNLWNTVDQKYWPSYYDAFWQKWDKNLKVNLKKD